MASRRRQERNRAAAVSAARTRVLVIAGASVVGLTVVLAAGFVLLSGLGSAPTSGPVFSPGVTAAQGETVVQGQGGHWINVTPDRLAQMLTHKDFALLNVKTPYIGEIDGTDLYIPYDQLTARASELPAARGAKILVYCRSGAESAQAAQTLLNLGYTNVWNLDGGMNAWTASGRTLVNLNR